jgi:hypothetical protein
MLALVLAVAWLSVVASFTFSGARSSLVKKKLSFFDVFFVNTETKSSQGLRLHASKRSPALVEEMDDMADELSETTAIFTAAAATHTAAGKDRPDFMLPQMLRQKYLYKDIPRRLAAKRNAAKALKDINPELAAELEVLF